MRAMESILMEIRKRLVAVPHLFNRWDHVRKRLQSARKVVLFLDFDGSLVPLRDKPSAVWLDERMRQALLRLARHRKVTLGIISGRRRSDLRRRARVHGVRYWGLHGREGQHGGLTGVHRRTLRLARLLLEERLAPLPGLWIEDKGAAFTVHYRRADARVARRARDLVRRTMRGFWPDVHLLEGKKVLEVLPQSIRGKGVATREFLSECPEQTLAIYVGDDATDENAFIALHGQVTVRVGKVRHTHAKFYVRSPAEVLSLLTRVEKELD